MTKYTQTDQLCAGWYDRHRA